MSHATASSPASAEIITFRARIPDASAAAKDSAQQYALARLIPVLDQLDHGIVLRDVDGTTHLNRLADMELANPGGPLQQRGGTLSAVEPDEAALLRRALADASVRGRRRVLTLRGPARTLNISIAPVQAVGVACRFPRSSCCPGGACAHASQRSGSLLPTA
jgi:hypothetical protein